MTELQYKHSRSLGVIEPYVELDVLSVDELKMVTNTQEQSVCVFEATPVVLDPDLARAMFEQDAPYLSINQKVHGILQWGVTNVELAKVIQYFYGVLDMCLG